MNWPEGAAAMEPTNTQAWPEHLTHGGGYLGAQDLDDADERSLPPVLLRYWVAAQRWRWLIAGIITAALAAAVILTLLATPLYVATSRIEISREQKNVTNIQGLDQQANPYDNEFYDTQYALLKAGSLAERVARNLKLADDPGFFAAHGIKSAADAQGNSNANAQPHKARENLAAGLLLGGIKIVPVSNSRLADITYISRSPQWSARIANAWPQQFISANLDQQFASTADARRFLEGRLENLRQKLQDSETNLINFGNASNIVTLGASRDATGRTEEPRTLVASNLEALNTALNAARTDRIAAQSRARTRTDAGSPDVVQNATISSLRSKRAEVASEYARLLVQFEPRYPAARALKEQIDALDGTIAREVGRINTGVSGGRQNSYQEAVSRENELAAQVASLRKQFDQQQRATIQYNVYQREVDTNRQLYAALLQRYKEVGLAGAVGTTNVVVVDPAKVPGGPTSPNLPSNLKFALLLGIALAAAAVFALEQLDQGIRDPGTIERDLHIPLIGTVPVAEDPQAQLSDTHSALSEAYFSSRTTLGLATSSGFPKSVAVTSTQSGEGKSITALALAAALGRTGKRVLLVDGDMRSPSIHTLTNRENSRGLSNVLSGENDYAALVTPTDFKGVSVLLAGPIPPSAAELLSTDRLRGLIEAQSAHFDHIVFDSPPVLGLADAPLLGEVVEGTVFVIQSDQTAVRHIRSTLRRLRIANNRIFGAILTQVEHDRLGYGYDYTYGYDGSAAKKAAAA